VLTLVRPEGRDPKLALLPASSALVSWTTSAAADTLELMVETVDGRRSHALPYVAFEPGARASLNGFDAVAAIETDVLRASASIAAVTIHSRAPLATVAASTPPAEPPRTHEPPQPAARRELDVPALSQYLADAPAERGWCAPASIAMVLGAHGVTVDVAAAAAGMYDRTYHGTGNWALAIAYAGTFGFAGAVAYLRDLVGVEHAIAAGLPLAVSIAWNDGDLPTAPLPQSAGHLLVVRGFDAQGDVIVNDPAQPAVRHVYARAAFARCWLAHGGVALLVAPPDRCADLMHCANA
jgi:hypothetical protein